MNLHESFAEELAQDVDVAALIADRIYPMVIPQKSREDAVRHGCLVYSRIASTRNINLCGTERLTQSTMQVDAYAATFNVAKDGRAGALAIARAARRCLTDFRGELGGTGGVVVKDIKCDSENEFTDPDPGLYRISQTYTIWHLDDA